MSSLIKSCKTTGLSYNMTRLCNTTNEKGLSAILWQLRLGKISNVFILNVECSFDND